MNTAIYAALPRFNEWRPEHGTVGAPLPAAVALAILAARNLDVWEATVRGTAIAVDVMHGCDGVYRLRYRLPGFVGLRVAYLQPDEVRAYFAQQELKVAIAATISRVQAEHAARQREKEVTLKAPQTRLLPFDKDGRPTNPLAHIPGAQLWLAKLHRNFWKNHPERERVYPGVPINAGDALQFYGDVPSRLIAETNQMTFRQHNRFNCYVVAVTDEGLEVVETHDDHGAVSGAYAWRKANLPQEETADPFADDDGLETAV